MLPSLVTRGFNLDKQMKRQLYFVAIFVSRGLARLKKKRDDPRLLM